MIKADQLINNFSGGELSPKLDPRSDLQKYQTGCRVLENMIPLVEGGAQARPGTYFVAEVKDSTKKPRLFPFQFSTVQAYIIEMGEEYIRFYKNNGQIVTTYAAWAGATPYSLGNLVTNGGNYYRCIVAHTSTGVFANDLASGYWVATGGASDLAYEIPSPYQESELGEIKVTQSADILYLAHRSHNIKKLSRTGDTVWTLTDFVARSSPIMNVTAITQANPCVVTVGTEVAQSIVITNTTQANPCVVTTAVLPPGVEFPRNGEEVHISNVAGMTELNGNIYTVANADSTARTFELSGIDSSAYFAYFADGNIYIPNRSTSSSLYVVGSDSKIYRCIKSHLSTVDDKPITGVNWATYWILDESGAPGETWASGTYYYPGDIPKEDDTVYISSVGGMTELNNIFYVAANPDPVARTFELKSINSTAYAAYTSGGTAYTTQFGSPGNNPGAIGFYDQRFVAGGTNNNPLSVYASASADLENFILDPEDASSALEYSLLSDKVDGIRWLLSEEYLMIGTQGGVWRLGASSTTEPLSQDNVNAKRQITTGCKDMDAEMVSDAVIYVQKGGTTLRRLEWSFERDKYTAQDITRVSKHISKGETLALSGIADMDYQSEPVPILWAVRADGELPGMVYEPSENVMAWFRVVTDGLFESVAVISIDGEEDQVWVIVNRTIGGVTKRYIEYFKPHDFFGVYKDAFFIDCGLTWDGGAAVTITGITQANPAVVSAAGHGFTNGMKVRITDVEGMTQANQGLTHAYTVANAAANTFELSGINSTAWNVYTSGGTAQRVANTVSGLTHLNGKSVAVLTNYGKHPARTVAAGSISLQFYANVITVGLPYTYSLQPMKFEPGTQEGTSRGRKKKIYALSVAFYLSAGAKWGPEADDLVDVPFGTGGQPPLFTGDKETDFSMDYATDASVYIQGLSPLPLTVLSVAPKMVVTDG